jgi:hypothetical protein
MSRAASRCQLIERAGGGWLPFLNTYRTMCIAPDEAQLAVFVAARQMHLGSYGADS